MSRIFAIVVTYNGLKWYNKCFTSLRNSTIPINIIVVDNASTDATAEFIKLYFQDIIYIQSQKNLGFGQANNYAIKIAMKENADYVFLLNQDAWIDSNTISNLINIHNKYPLFGVLSPFHLNGSGTKLEFGFFDFLQSSRSTLFDFTNDTFFEKEKSVYEIAFINAAAWLISKECIQIVGGFDPIFFHYGEDDNYCQRVLYHQFKIGICPNTIACHDTEKRTIAKSFLENMDKKDLLVKYTDIRYNLSVNSYLYSTLIKVLFKILKGQISSAIKLIENSKYLFFMKEKINISRKQNQTKGTSWL